MATRSKHGHCEHKSIKFCDVCQTVYCEGCNLIYAPQWMAPPTCGTSATVVHSSHEE